MQRTYHLSCDSRTSVDRGSAFVGILLQFQVEEAEARTIEAPDAQPLGINRDLQGDWPTSFFGTLFGHAATLATFLLPRGADALRMLARALPLLHAPTRQLATTNSDFVCGDPAVLVCATCFGIIISSKLLIVGEIHLAVN